MMIEDEELRNLYKISSEERLQKIEAGLLYLEKYPDDKTTSEQLLLEAHSLKGDSRIVGIENVEVLAHQVEKILGSIKRQQTVLTPEVSACLYQGLDAIGLLVQEAVTGQPSGVEISEILSQLSATVLESQQPQQKAALEQGHVPQPAPSFIEDEELRNLYKISEEERLQNLEAGLRHLEKYPDDKTILEQLQRDAHSIKGDSRSLGLENVEVLAHQVEEILGSIKRQQTVLTSQVSAVLYQGLDAIGLLVHEAVTGQPSGVEISEIQSQLSAAVLASQQQKQEAALEHNYAPQTVPSFIEDEELRDVYQVTSEERLQRLEAGLRHLEQHPDNETILRQLQREAHSLKGDARSVGLESVQAIAHILEEILDSINCQQTVFTPQLSASLYQGLDVIGLLVHEAVTGQPSGVEISEIQSQLSAAVLASQQQKQEAALEHNYAPQTAPSFIEDEELRDVYQVTSEERLQRLEAGLRHLEQHPDNETILRQLQREAHSLKGDARSVGLESVQAIAHILEEILDSINCQQTVFTPQLSVSLYQGLDAIGLLVHEAVTGQPSGVEISEIESELSAAVLASQQPQPEAVTGQPSRVEISELLSQLSADVLESQQPQQEATLEHNHAPQTAPSFIEDEELRDVYQVVSKERLQKLEAGLLHLEKHPEDKMTLGQLLREAHSLKGDARSVGLENVEALTHTLEEILGSINCQQTILTIEVSDRLYQGLDAIGKLVHEAVTGQPSGVDTAQMLNHLIETISVPNIQESLLISPAKRAAQDLVAPPISVSEPYRIDTIRVQTRELDALMTQAEELTVTKIGIAHASAEIEVMANLWEEWKAAHRKGQNFDSSSLSSNPYQDRLEKMMNSLRTSTQENSTRLDVIAGELREKIRTLRLLPLSTVFQLFPRMVRDLARHQSKEVELIIEGEETTADKRILEEIKDSLMHMVRNAIDHGIETPAERERLGKPRVATIWLRGYQTTTNIVIEVADDGRGLDIEKIKQTAIRRGLYQPEELLTMAPSQIHALLFAPGFSTRTFITEISGRGIGLDVVRTNVEQLKGNIQIESTFGQGCTFRIELGTTLAIINALIFEVQGFVHAIPIEFVQTTLLVSDEQILTTQGQNTIAWDGQDVSVTNLADLLELSNSLAYTSTVKVEQPKNDLQHCILIKVGEEQSGFFVDRLLDTQEVVLKPQSQLLKRVRHVNGATILPSGEVCMILNPPDLLKSLQKQTTSVVSTASREIVRRKPVILLVEDSIFVRTQEKRLLERAGYEVVIAVDGLDGYNKLKTRDFDAVLSDVEMPYLDGLSLTAKIRQHQEYRELPIILVTTLASDQDIRRGAEAGADAYIIKGKFNQDFLLETLGKLV